MIAMIAMKQNKQTWGRQEVAQAEAILAAVTEAISSIESSERAAVIFRIFVNHATVGQNQRSLINIIWIHLISK